MHPKSQQHTVLTQTMPWAGGRGGGHRWLLAAGAGLLVWAQQLLLLLSPSCIFLCFQWAGFSLSLQQQNGSRPDRYQSAVTSNKIPAFTLSVGYSCVDGNCSVLLFLPLFQYFSENSVIPLVFPCAISAWGTVFLPTLTLTNQIVLK